MRESILRHAEQLNKSRRRRMRRSTVVCCLACLVTASTVYALIRPAITQEGQPYCGIIEHAHDETCFEHRLICDLPEDETHSHIDSCYEDVLICESAEHIHTLTCYSNPNAGVETSADWEAAFIDVELTGVWPDDLLTIANTQLGYTESTDNYTVLEDGISTRGYTRYGAWYGDPYGDWDAMFVSFCLHYSGVPEDIFPYASSCSQWMEQLDECGFYVPANEYMPYAGDLVFFDLDGDGSTDRVGIVSEATYAGSEEDPALASASAEQDQGPALTSLIVIEGDCDGAVALQKYDGADAAILGYATLPAGDNGIMMLAEEAATAAAVESENGSVSWTTLSMTTEIQEGTAYAITSQFGKYAITTGAYTSGSPNGLSGSSGVSEADIIWYFEPTGSENTWYISTTVDGELKYLQLSGGALTIVDETQRSAFTATVSGDNILLWCDADRNYINAYGGEGGFTRFAGWYDSDAGSQLRLYQVETVTVNARTDTVSPASTVINLFDYWISDDRWDTPEMPNGAENLGINQGHTFKFGPKGSGYNAWTGDGGGAYQAIVQSKLVGGYPVLNSAVTGASESLDYLFNPSLSDTEVGGRKTFMDVKSLLVKDSDGYYAYDCRANYAEFDEASNRFTVYESPQKMNNDDGQFFPFDQLADVHDVSNWSDVKLHHYFGMTITSHFYQQNGGKTYEGGTEGKDTTFEFTGDDDVWVFIDDVLVGDVGGIHDPCTLTINFATGAVAVAPVSSAGLGTQTTIRAAFEAAGMDTSTGFNGNTFADGTTHTLKFYFLERGAGGSTLRVKYNLVEIPETMIYKVDQYGDPISGAVFAVYPAVKASDGTYRYKTSSDDAVGIVLGEGDTVSESGTITLSDGRTVEPAYIGITDSKGEMLFKDSADSPYTLAAIGTMFGDHFIMREVYVPPGYRNVSNEAWIRLHGGVMFCDNTYKSGVWASNNALVTAQRTLYKAGDTEAAPITYYTTDNGVINATGTLFAVVLKRNGAALHTNAINDWYPVYGNDTDGYIVSESSGIQAVIDTVKKARTYGNVVFSPTSVGMQVYLENLPGKIENYYTWILENDPTNLDKAEYLVAYYYTDAENGLDGADESNTFRVHSHTVTSNSEVKPFELAWGTTLEVPNFENRLYFQKQDGDGNLIKVDSEHAGATFALYQAMDAPNQAEDTKYVYYIGENAKTGDTSYIALLTGESYAHDAAAVFEKEGSGARMIGWGNCKIDGTTGVITVTVTEDQQHVTLDPQPTYTVRPAKNAAGDDLIGVVHDECTYVKEEDTGHFNKLLSGQYYLREISAPAGYSISDANIPVLVNENGVYANAGEPGDGVYVGNGIGFLTKTLDVFASLGQIDETLSWVYATLLQNTTAGFAAFDEVSGDVIRVTEKGSWAFVSSSTESGTSKERSDALVTYLEYNGKLSADPNKTTIFDYTPTADQTARTTDMGLGQEGVATGQGEGSQRLFTDTGWTDLAVYQDHAYGITQVIKNKTTTYDDLTGLGNMSNLFSSSTFVRVTDYHDLIVKAVDASNRDLPLSGAQFRLYRLNESGETMFYELTNGLWSTDGEVALTTTDEDGLTGLFRRLPNGTYFLTGVKPPDGYYALGNDIQVVVSSAGVTVQGSAGVSVESSAIYEDTNGYIQTVVVPFSSGYELPETGGSGAARYTLLGLFLCAGAIFLFWRRKPGVSPRGP